MKLRPICAADLAEIRHAAVRSVMEQQAALGLPHAHVMAAIEKIFSVERLEQSVGLVVEDAHRRSFALASESHSIFGGPAEGLLHTLVGDQNSVGREISRQLVAGIEQASREQGWRLLRACVPWEETYPEFLFPAATGWEETTVTVLKSLTAQGCGQLSNQRLRIRMAQEADTGAIVGWLAEALDAGMSAVERRFVDDAGIAAAAQRLLAQVVCPDMAIVVATEPASDIALGHATAHLNRIDELTGMRHTMLYDAMVCPAYRQQGVADALIKTVERLALMTGHSLIVGTVTAKDPAQQRQLLAAVRSQGWQPQNRRFIKLLAQ